jgi:hypothetical protein
VLIVNRGQLISRSKRDDKIAINVRRCARRHNQTATLRARKGRKRALDVAGVALTPWKDPTDSLSFGVKKEANHHNANIKRTEPLFS